MWEVRNDSNWWFSYLFCCDWCADSFGVLYSKSILMIILSDSQFPSLPITVLIRLRNKEQSESVEFPSYVVVTQNSKHRLNKTEDANGDIWKLDVRLSSRLLGPESL